MEQKVVVEAKGLFKKIQDRVIVDGVTFRVMQGECFGILGPNGAGKTTTMKMMYGSSSIDGGELSVLGLNAKYSRREIKARIGVVAQDDGLDSEFTVQENLLLFSQYHGIDRDLAFRRSEDLLKLMRLEEHAEQFVHTLSGGMKRRLAIARGMVNHPELLILDEPTSGLDPQARLRIWNFVRSIKSDMGTVIMTTHYMEEAENICDRIAIMDRGKILTIGEPPKLIREQIGHHVVEITIPKADLQYYLARLNSKNLQYQVIENKVNVHLREDEDAKDALKLVEGLKVTLRNPTLSDIFLKLAGQDLRDDIL